MGNFNPRSPRGERLSDNFNRLSPIGNFNPRSPRGERHLTAIDNNVLQATFQSTLPAGGATTAVLDALRDELISIHAPRGGSDFTISSKDVGKAVFQSTLPAGGATVYLLCG